MRGERINVPGLPAGMANMRRAIEGKRSPQVTAPQFKFTAHDGKDLKRPAIQGYAAHFEKVFAKGERLVYFKSEAFAGNWFNSSDRRLLFDHDPKQDYGGTADGLEFDRNINGLIFRMPLAGAKGKAIYDTVKSGERASVSVGIDILDSEIREVRGHRVEIVKVAKLEEISLCTHPACPDTHASIVDLDDEHDVLWCAARERSFGQQQAAANIAARAHRIAEALKGA